MGNYEAVGGRTLLIRQRRKMSRQARCAPANQLRTAIALTDRLAHNTPANRHCDITLMLSGI